MRGNNSDRTNARPAIAKPMLVLGSAVAIAGLIAVAPAHAATGTSGQCTGQKTGQQNGQSNTGSSSASEGAMKQPTNQQTGAPGSPKPMSHQKANQAKTAPKTQQ